MGQCHVGAGKYALIDSHCVEDEQRILEANDEFLTKENAEEHNDENDGDAEIKGKKHHSCLQEQQRKAGKAAAEEAPPPVEDEEHRDSADNCGNATEEGVPPSDPAEDE